MTQAHIIYSGTVQGVGFRYTIQKYALKFNLLGWVKNLPNGSVEVLIEGSKDDIELLCNSVEEFFSGYIKNKEIAFSDRVGKYHSFEITY